MNDATPSVRPVRFGCKDTLRIPRREIFEGLLNLEKWNSFKGYGPLPGIREATFVLRNDEGAGSVIRVENTDGSVHQERILEWLPNERAVIELSGFAFPLSALASRFVETWSFAVEGEASLIRRDFELYPVNECARPVLWMISLLLRRAVSRHLRVLAKGDHSGESISLTKQ